MQLKKTHAMYRLKKNQNKNQRLHALADFEKFEES